MTESVKGKGSARVAGKGRGRCSKTSGGGAVVDASRGNSHCGGTPQPRLQSLRVGSPDTDAPRPSIDSKIGRIQVFTVRKSNKIPKIPHQTPPIGILDRFSLALRQFSPISDQISPKLEAFSLGAEAFCFMSHAFCFISKGLFLLLDEISSFFRRFHHHLPFTTHL